MAPLLRSRLRAKRKPKTGLTSKPKSKAGLRAKSALRSRSTRKPTRKSKLRAKPSTRESTVESESVVVSALEPNSNSNTGLLPLSQSMNDVTLVHDDTEESYDDMEDEMEERRILSEFHIKRIDIKLGPFMTLDHLPFLWSEQGHEQQVFLNAFYTPNMGRNLWIVSLWGPVVNNLVKIVSCLSESGIRYEVRGFVENTRPPVLRSYLFRSVLDNECNFGFPDNLISATLDFVITFHKDLKIRKIWTEIYERTGKIKNKLWLLDTK